MDIFENIKTAVNQVIDAESKKYNPMFEDLVKIVRCKNCKYFKHSDEYTMHYGRCEILLADMNDCDYCSYGARKDKSE